MKLSLETSDDIANFYGGQEILKNELHDKERKAREIRQVTASQIKSLATSIFKNNKLNLAVIGPFRGKKDEARFSKILKF